MTLSSMGSRWEESRSMRWFRPRLLTYRRRRTKGDEEEEEERRKRGDEEEEGR